MKNFLLNRLCLVFVLLISILINTAEAQVVANVSQTTVSAVFPGDVDQPIVVITMNVGTAGYSLYSFFLSTGISTPTAIANAKVFYTGTSNSFSTGTQFGSTVASPNGAFTISSGGPFPLPVGLSHFWVTYDITLEAVFCDTVDALCSSIYGSLGTFSPVPSDPAGYAVIGDQDCIPTNFAEQLIETDAFVFPNPSAGNFLVRLNEGSENIPVMVFNLMGEKVFETTGSDIHLVNLPPAIYLLRAIKDNCTYNSRVIITR
jgi:hypothetical protein